MGNENSKSSELKKEEKIPEKHENGPVNGSAPKATPNGLLNDVKNEAAAQQDGQPPSDGITIVPAEYVIIDSESQTASDQVSPEIPDATTEKPPNDGAAPEIPDSAQATPDTPDATDVKPSNDQVTPDTPDATNDKPDSDQVTPDTPDSTDEKPVEAPEAATVNEEEKKVKKEKVNIFSKMFKKKEQPSPPPPEAETVEEKNTSSEDQSDVSPPPNEPQVETADSPKQEAEALVEPQPETPESAPREEEEKAPESEEANSEAAESREETGPEDSSVMNFLKTLVNTTKTSKKETASPDAAKDQSQTESQPAATTTVAQISEPPAPPKGMSIPPPPPPEPPKLEVKGEPSAKAAKPSPKEEPKAAAKEAESSKGKSAKDALSSFFRQKVRLGIKTPKRKGASASGAKTAAVTIKDVPEPAVQIEVQPEETPVEAPEPVQIEDKVDLQEAAVEVAQSFVGEVQQVFEDLLQPEVEAEVDPSKTGTLEAAAKPEPPAPVQEEKKTSKSPFLSLFKPKALLDHMTTKVQAASTSGVRLLRKTSGLGAASKKETATPPAAAAEAAQAAKAKEEPKAAAKSSEVVVDNKAAPAASQAADDAAKGAKKLEKRNSIQGFFKNLSQKRHSTDAGVQTEAATEKAK
ncbi:breast carcinoma-amplified sequence 1 isoform X2 [Salarias fasciatus]|uniref:breast carcinoma-amplified sequence 1 isoform X2 n=1 Tax=Salarias fasciatus TaxID=181472 RepID=UPI0011767D2E|nr:translation initiation factor IF-2-like isoform X2 [Salarias fasciatus]